MKTRNKIVLIYLMFGISWIFLSDYFSNSFVGAEELADTSLIQTFKGMFFVLSTSTLLFLLMRKYDKQNDVLIENLKELNHTSERRGEEFKRSWGLFKNLFELSPAPMWIIDWETMKFLNVNEAAIQQYGYSKEQFKTMTLFDLRSNTIENHLTKFVEQERLRDTGLFQGNFKHKRKNGEEIIVSVNVQKIDYFGKDARMTIANDITEILEVQQNLKNAYDNIIHVEEHERNRIAGELHDGLIQQIVAAKQFASFLVLDPLVKNAETLRNQIVEILNGAILESNRMIQDLRPKQLKSAGLVGSIQQIITHCDQVENIKINANYSDMERLELNEYVKFNIFRIFQENLNNTIRHSKATNVNLIIDCHDDTIKYDYWDNGIGVSEKLQRNTNSFLSIKRRLKSIGGFFNVCNKVHSGAHFSFSIPLELRQLKIN
jgi:PAS domain S-box-containing protein